MTDPVLPEIGREFSLKVNGVKRTFKHFMPKQINIVKIHLPGEGIWACLSDEDMEDYRKDVKDPPEVVRVATLRNSSINGPPWGCYVPYRMDGMQTPEGCIEEIDDGQEMVLNQYDAVEPTEEERAEHRRKQTEDLERRQRRPEISQRHLEAMKSMGYRKMAKDAPLKWAKPIGGQLLTIELDRREMTLWFEGAEDASPQRWNTQNIFAHQGDNDQDDLNALACEIKHAEADLIQCWRGRINSQFHFLTSLEAVRIAVDVD